MGNSLCVRAIAFGVIYLVFAHGCSSSPSEPRPSEDLFVGGVITPTGCNYEVRTRVGATAPSVAQGDTVGADPEPRNIHVGISGDPARSMVVTWRVGDLDTDDVELLFGETDASESRAPITWRYRPTFDTEYRAYEVHLCELEPDTVYQYQVRSGPVYSSVASFRTAPDPADGSGSGEEIVIVALGDARGGPDILARLLSRADQLVTPDLILFTGDMVGSGGRQDQWDRVFELSDPVLRRVPVLTAVGNHEAEYELFHTTWALPGNERRFSLDYGAAHIVVLDDSSLLLPDENGLGEDFLRADLATVGDDTWRLVVHHQPVFSAQTTTGYGSTQRLQERWMPIYDQFQVDLVLNGHDHKYERTQPLRGGELAANGTIYMVLGGAGAPLLDNLVSEPFTAVTLRSYHYTVLRVRPEFIEATTYDDVDTVLDTFMIQP